MWRRGAVIGIGMVWVASCGPVTPPRPGSIGQVDAPGRRIDVPPEAAPRHAGLERVSEQQAMLDAIRRGLEVESALLAASVEVAADGPGRVVLTGQVDNQQLARRAQQIAIAVWGVTSVGNELRVMPPVGSAAEVEANVRAALAADPALAETTLQVELEGGRLVLGGWAPQPALRARAERIAAGIAGVLVVANQIRTIPRLPPPAGNQLVAEVRRRVWDVEGADAGRITVTRGRRPGLIVLEGSVDSFRVRRGVLTAAWAFGVDEVDARGLRVVWRSDQIGRKSPVAEVVPGLRPAGGAAGDRALAAQVSAALARDPYLDSGTIRVRAQAGHVHLEGWVDAPFEAQRAQAIASTVRGVDRITNSLQLGSPAR